MSLWATGIPVSGCPAPLAMSASAARACARLLSESMVMKAFSFPFSASMRARKAFVSSTLENFLCASPAASSLSEASSMDPGAPTRIPLLDHLGNEIEPPLHLRRNRLKAIALVALGHRVVAQAQREPLGVRHRGYAFGVDGLHRADQLENLVELALDGARFGVINADPGQLGDCSDLFGGQGHEKSLKTEIYLLYYNAIANPLS